MIGQQKTEQMPVRLAGYDSDRDLAEALNSFYLRFDTHDVSDKLKRIHKESGPLTKPNQMFVPQDVKAAFQKIKTNKSPGSDGITGRLLKNCEEQLCEVFCYIFWMSLDQCRVPRLWKESIVVPIAKNRT